MSNSERIWSNVTWAVAETPMICVLFCLPFRHLFREPFAMWHFSFAASMCLKYTFANFRGKSWKESPLFPGKHILKHLFPTCHVRVSRFYQSSMPPIASSPPPPPPASPPQVPAPDLSGHCRTSCCGGGVLVVMMVMVMARIMIMNRNQHKSKYAANYSKMVSWNMQWGGCVGPSCLERRAVANDEYTWP